MQGINPEIATEEVELDQNDDNACYTALPPKEEEVYDPYRPIEAIFGIPIQG